MPMIYKLDVLSALKEAGYNTNRIRKEKLIGEAMLQKIRERSNAVCGRCPKPFALYWTVSRGT
ncbi:MAG: hypothetical protein V8S92_04460 [Oscillospiraceae bacterium]